MITCNLDEIKLTPILESLEIKKIPDEEYFGPNYAGYISNSRLGALMEEGPDAFFAGIPAKYSDALLFGSAVHELVLQPEYFELVESVERSTAKKGFMHDYLYPIWLEKGSISDQDIAQASNEINYYKGKMNRERADVILQTGLPYWQARADWEVQDHDKAPIYLDVKSRERLKSCINALNKDKNIQSLLHPEGLLTTPISENEWAVLIDIKVEMPKVDPFIIKVKSKLDNYTIDSDTDSICVNDVKTIGKVLSYFDDPIEGNFNKYHYYREMAIYSWLLSLVAKTKYNIANPTISANCLVVSTIPDFYTKVYKVTKADFAKGWLEFTQLIKKACRYVDEYSQNSLFHSLLAWIEKT